jgi:integrase
MIRMLADCGLRVGELFALERDAQDLHADEFVVTGTAWNGRVIRSSREKRHDRTGPIPPGCLALLRAMPPRIDSPWLFPTPKGKLWRHENWRRVVWYPTCRAAGFAPLAQDFRHSYVSLLSAAGVDLADLADMTGHTVAVASAHYRHPLRRSFDDVRRAVG